MLATDVVLLLRAPHIIYLLQAIKDNNPKVLGGGFILFTIEHRIGEFTISSVFFVFFRFLSPGGGALCFLGSGYLGQPDRQGHELC